MPVAAHQLCFATTRTWAFGFGGDEAVVVVVVVVLVVVPLLAALFFDPTLDASPPINPTTMIPATPIAMTFPSVDCFVQNSRTIQSRMPRAAG